MYICIYVYIYIHFTYACKYIHNKIIKLGVNTNDNCNFHFFKWSPCTMVITGIYSYHLSHPEFLFPLSGTPASLSSSPGKVTQTFIPEESGPLIVMLDCSSFPLTLIKGCSKTKRCPKGSSVF